MNAIRSFRKLVYRWHEAEKTKEQTHEVPSTEEAISFEPCTCGVLPVYEMSPFRNFCCYILCPKCNTIVRMDEKLENLQLDDEYVTRVVQELAISWRKEMEKLREEQKQKSFKEQFEDKVVEKLKEFGLTPSEDHKERCKAKGKKA